MVKVEAHIYDEVTEETSIETHELKEFTAEELRLIIVRENQEQVGEDQYDGSSLTVIEDASKVEDETACVVLQETGAGSFGDYQITINATVL